MIVVSLIVAAAENNVIGKANRLPWNLPRELAHFKAVTTGHHIIMVCSERGWSVCAVLFIPSREGKRTRVLEEHCLTESIWCLPGTLYTTTPHNSCFAHMHVQLPLCTFSDFMLEMIVTLHFGVLLCTIHLMLPYRWQEKQGKVRPSL